MPRRGGAIVSAEVDRDKVLTEKVEAIKQLIAEQEKYCVDQYQIGLYNGLVIGLSVLTGEEPRFYVEEE
nr:MAG TPA: hypothetical protein [Bacteriophage sp.]